MEGIARYWKEYILKKNKKSKKMDAFQRDLIFKRIETKTAFFK